MLESCTYTMSTTPSNTLKDRDRRASKPLTCRGRAGHPASKVGRAMSTLVPATVAALLLAARSRCSNVRKPSSTLRWTIRRVSKVLPLKVECLQQRPANVIDARQDRERGQVACDGGVRAHAHTGVALSRTSVGSSIGYPTSGGITTKIARKEAPELSRQNVLATESHRGHAIAIGVGGQPEGEEKAVRLAQAPLCACLCGLQIAVSCGLNLGPQVQNHTVFDGPFASIRRDVVVQHILKHVTHGLDTSPLKELHVVLVVCARRDGHREPEA
mmetsp:Transcript_58114/g.189273  ORF Transcript_58114/g.189273 Transcript_58114/m.189273 type:complete len:272 (-) Transcript_58114:1264-2079(-)